MANPALQAFQVTFGAFQGVGQFAFQGDVVAPKTGTGGIDPGEGEKRVPFKPTGLLDRPVKEGRKDVADRVDDSAQIAAEIAARLAKEFGEETLEIESAPPVEEMSMAEVNAEIGVLLRKRMRTEEDEVVLLLLMAAAAA